MDEDVILDDELLGEFIRESRKHLTTIDADLLAADLPAIEEGGARSTESRNPGPQLALSSRRVRSSSSRSVHSAINLRRHAKTSSLRS